MPMRFKAAASFALPLVILLGLLGACHKKVLPPAGNTLTLGRAAFIIDEDFNVKEPVIELMGLTHLKKVTSLRDAVTETQASWLRPAQHERCQETEHYAHLKPIMLTLFNRLSIIAEVEPRQNEYDYILLLGAMYETMISRTQFLQQILASKVKAKKIILLGSHRPLDRHYEIDPMLKNHIFHTLPITEIEMMQALMATPSLKKLIGDIEIIPVASSMKMNSQGQMVRANTQDTVVDLLKLKLTPGSALVISSQPYVLRQDLVVKSLASSPWRIETVGPRAPLNIPTNVYLDELGRILYEVKGFYLNHI